MSLLWILFSTSLFAQASQGSASTYRLASLSISSQLRTDILKIELFPYHSRFGVGLNMFSLRYGNWKYPITVSTYDTFGNLTGKNTSTAKSTLFPEVFPLSVFYTPYYWEKQDGNIGRFRVFYEYSTTWLIKDQVNLSGNCAYGDNSLGNRITQDYGGMVDLGPWMRFKAGYVAIKRRASECGGAEDHKVYKFGALKTSKWYAGIEMLFGGKSGEPPSKSSRLSETVDFLGKAAAGAASAPFLFWGLIFEDSANAMSH